MEHRGRRSARYWTVLLLTLALLTGCGPGTAAPRAAVQRPVEALTDSAFAALVARISEPGGFFDTDNLISNESGYLKVMGALRRLGLQGGAYVGVGPDQNFSYVTVLRPDIVFITDLRRDNLLHHLLHKALIERAETRVEFLAGLHGRPAPLDPAAWTTRSVDDVVAYVDGQQTDPAVVEGLHAEVAEAVRSYGIPLTDQDLATIRRFHQTFIDAGLGLRFTTFGRAPRPYYPTYRQLVVETDLAGEQASYLVDEASYAVVRSLHVANRIIPVVGDMAGDHALAEMGEVMREMGVELSAFYASNVEFYLWGGRTFGAWEANLSAMPVADDAVIIRSYFPNFGSAHPSAVPGYFATQTLQPAAVLLAGGFSSYRDVVTRGIILLN